MRFGERHYIHHAPHVSVHPYPEGKTEKICYKTEEVMIYGHKLRAVDEDLKANTPEVLRESEGPQDADKPYTERIAYRMRL